MLIDINRLKEDLLDECYGAYFGAGLGGALVESFDIEPLSPEALIKFAANNGIDLLRYQR